MTPTLKTFTATMWEKAEHWTFEVVITAKDELSARKQLAREYPRKDYSIRELGCYHCDQRNPISDWDMAWQ